MAGASVSNVQPTAREFLLGSMLCMVTMTVWAGWNVVSRMGVGDALQSAEIVFLRFAVAGIICIPIAWRHRAFYRATKGWCLLAMVVGAGAPYVWVATKGFEHASAAHGVLIPGSMLCWVALMSHHFLGERFNLMRLAGYALILLTVLYRLISDNDVSGELLISDGMFLASGFMWAVYTVVNRYTGIKPVQALALVAVGSLVGFCLPYAAMHSDRIVAFPLQPALVQMLYQGIMVSFVAFVCYNRAIGLIGPSRASAFAAVIPLITVLMAIPILKEIPSNEDWVFVGLLTLGVLSATGALRRLLGVKSQTSL